jgi:hypothetical protein
MISSQDDLVKGVEVKREPFSLDKVLTDARSKASQLSVTWLNNRIAPLTIRAMEFSFPDYRSDETGDSKRKILGQAWRVMVFDRNIDLAPQSENTFLNGRIGGVATTLCPP